VAAAVDNEWPDAAARGLRRYVRLVAEAVGAGSSAWCCEVDARSTAYVALEGRIALYPDHDVALVWDERTGWAAAVESASSDDLLLIAYLGDDVLPSPRQVAQYVGELLADPPVGSLKPPHFRKQGADEGLAARLCDYVARSEQWKPLWRRIGSPDVWGGSALV
jgi:hypothetical protein